MKKIEAMFFSVKQYKFEFILLALSLFIYLHWLLKIPIILGIVIFLIIFGYLFYKKKPISHFLIVILFSVMAGTINSFIDFTLTGILFMYIVYLNFKHKKIVIGSLIYIIVIYYVYNAISLLWAPHLLDGLSGLGSMLQGYLIYYIITNSKIKINGHLPNVSKIATFIMAIVTFQIITVYLQKGVFEVFGDKNLLDLGWGISNLIAVIYVFLIPIAFYKYTIKEKYYIGYFIFDLLNVIGFLLTLSKGGYLGLFVGVLIFIIFNLNKHLITRYGSIVFGLLAIVLIIPKTWDLIDKVIDTLVSGGLFKHHGRMDLYNVAIDRFLDNIWFGQGIKSSHFYILQYTDRTNIHYHSFILQVAATLGIVGLIMLFYQLFKWFKIVYKPKDKFAMSVTAAVVGSLVHQLLDVSFDLYLYFSLFMYTLIGLIEVYRHYNQDDELTLKEYKQKPLVKSNNS